MLNIVIFGAPGCGKGTQSELIIQKYGLTHISTGDVLREEIARKTELGKIAEEYICKGQLVPDDLTIKMLAEVIDKHKENAEIRGFIFDGFPRTLPQGEALDVILKERGESIAVALNLDVAEAELIQRLLKRGIQSGRSDDNYEVIKCRLDIYNNQTQPLKDYYKKQGKHINIKGIGTIDDIFAKISETLDRICMH